MFLAQNHAQYDKPVEDPWFKATRAYTYPQMSGLGDNRTIYLSDFAVTVMGCIDQFEFCNPNNDKCTPKTTAINVAVNETLEPLGLNTVQRDTIAALASNVISQTTYTTVRTRGANALRASDSLNGNTFIADSLPKNQWTIEITEWFAVSMAKMQQLVLDYASGPKYSLPSTHLSAGKPAVCARQKIRSASGYISFSIFGLALILTASALLILIATSLDAVVGSLMRRSGWKDYKRVQWAVDEKLQLQRLAFEGAGQGYWSRGANAVPVTRDAEMIGLPSELSRNHRTLRRTGEGRWVGRRAAGVGEGRGDCQPAEQSPTGTGGGMKGDQVYVSSVPVERR